ncbi:hypothetical protein [Paraburkholderia kirstenboschensis]|uniref:Uncharacterized protein n=1 Tax=Paraburkholderia kirstenboschensis TaxID=1245436 RepID=A0ABZ0EMV2_9BURK|nr:hypothetical protein [Paraburkholderia kirstenboschensis]WOD18270.1 hypothetical protein RW095_36540 [Paraburkholderia kirstenboschensis]
MTKAKRDAGSQDAVLCPVAAGILVEVDNNYRLMWITAEKCKLTFALGIDDINEFAYEGGTLGIVLHSMLHYIEIPCSRPQAENILRKVGRDPRILLPPVGSH